MRNMRISECINYEAGEFVANYVEGEGYVWSAYGIWTPIDGEPIPAILKFHITPDIIMHDDDIADIFHMPWETVRLSHIEEE